LGIPKDRLKYRLIIQEHADVVAASEFWSVFIDVPPDQFKKPTLKKHNHKTVRRTTGENYK
jgi:hypothetical protein